MTKGQHTPTVSEQLKAAYALIGAGKDKSKWTQHSYARSINDNGDDNECPALSEYAVCFCSFGALERATGLAMGISDTPPLIQALAERIMAAANTLSLVSFNDMNDYLTVCAAWERAIAAAEADEAKRIAKVGGLSYG